MVWQSSLCKFNFLTEQEGCHDPRYVGVPDARWFLPRWTVSLLGSAAAGREALAQHEASPQVGTRAVASGK